MAGPERVNSLIDAFKGVPDKRDKLPRFKSALSPNVIIVGTDRGSVSALLKNPNVSPFTNDESPKSKKRFGRS